ncbi:hypothetical protein GCM10012286_35360 [Streptomyces lasiicapitis]|uniref:MbtH-like domain-containing protein n=2 Tax=Streptomyces TaxID=1883 RepID=A0ABQ2M1F0_9ACTN|nr:hypothetical protein GCM10012286_35360 [Streptomyces lasiicapitis]
MCHPGIRGPPPRGHRPRTRSAAPTADDAVRPEDRDRPTDHGDPDMDENTRYQVLRNDEDQYSLWPVDVDVPAGWQPVGKEGTETECSAYVDEVWTDMRPRSLRERMENAGS